MEISHIEHIGIAVPDLAEAIKYYEEVLGLKCYKQEVVEDQKVTTAITHWLSLLRTEWPTLWPSARRKVSASSTRLPAKVPTDCRSLSFTLNALRLCSQSSARIPTSNH